jgi:hypothetical protein
MFIDIALLRLVQAVLQLLKVLGFIQVFDEIVARIKLSRNVALDIDEIEQTVGKFQDAVSARQTFISKTVSGNSELVIATKGINKELRALIKTLWSYHSLVPNQLLLARSTAIVIRKEIALLQVKIRIRQDLIVISKALPTTGADHKNAYASTVSVDKFNAIVQKLKRRKNDLRQLKENIQPETRFCQALAHRVCPLIHILLLMVVRFSVLLSWRYLRIFALVVYLTVPILLTILFIAYEHTGNCNCWIRHVKEQPEGEQDRSRHRKNREVDHHRITESHPNWTNRSNYSRRQRQLKPQFRNHCREVQHS